MEAIILDTPEAIEFARLATLKAGLKLELVGLRKRGRSCYAILKDMGYKGSKAKVLAKVEADVKAAIENKA